jgi:hypothetical protein
MPHVRLIPTQFGQRMEPSASLEHVKHLLMAFGIILAIGSACSALAQKLSFQSVECLHLPSSKDRQGDAQPLMTAEPQAFDRMR